MAGPAYLKTAHSFMRPAGARPAGGRGRGMFGGWGFGGGGGGTARWPVRAQSPAPAVLGNAEANCKHGGVAAGAAAAFNPARHPVLALRAQSNGYWFIPAKF